MEICQEGAKLPSQLPFPLIRCPAVDVYIRKRGNLEPVLAQHLLIVVSTVLRRAVGVMNAPWWRPLDPHRHPWSAIAPKLTL
jgi:hypothetical protein